MQARSKSIHLTFFLLAFIDFYFYNYILAFRISSKLYLRTKKGKGDVMKRHILSAVGSILMCISLAYSQSPDIFEKNSVPLKAADPDSGTVEMVLTLPPLQCGCLGNYSYHVYLYHSNWEPVQLVPWGLWPSVNTYIKLPAGDYYAVANRFSEWVYECSSGSTHFSYYDNFYFNSSSRDGASLIHVSAGDTTKGIRFDLQLREYIYIATSPNAFPLVMNGSQISPGQYFCPFFRTYPYGSNRTFHISAYEYHDSPDGGRYYFDNWNRGGSREQDYTVPYLWEKDTLIARYVYKYRLDVLSDHGTPSGAGWNTAWDPASFSVPGTIVEKIPPHAFPAKALAPADTDSVRYVLRGWTGTGTGSYTGPDNPATVIMNSNITETAAWKIQFPLVTLVNDTAAGSLVVNPPGVWQDRDILVTITAVPKYGYIFAGWEGSETGSAAGLSIVMDSSKTVTARFERASHPPVLAIPDVSFAEDEILVIPFVSLITWISDPVDPIFALNFEMDYDPYGPAKHLQGNFDLNRGVFQFWADPDWNGNGWFSFRVTDPLGGFDADTIRYTVTPVDDPPGPFTLVFPADGFVYDDAAQALPFRWTRSANRDEANGDAIRYAFHFGIQGNPLDSAAVIDDTTFALPNANLLPDGTYHWKVRAFDNAGNSVWSGSEGSFQVLLQSGVGSQKTLPTEYRLSQNYPNPFNPVTDLSYALPERTHVRIEIFTADGRRIRTLVNEEKQAGQYAAVWNGLDEAGRKAVSGVYLCRMNAGTFSRTIKMTVMK
jgi:uncharacterized repeat protein (TIGR02543 family)